MIVPSGSLELLPLKLTSEGRGAARRDGSRDGGRWLIRRDVPDAPDRPSVEVGVEEVAAGAELEVDGVRGSGDEGLDATRRRERCRLPSSSPRCSRASSRRRTARRGRRRGTARPCGTRRRARRSTSVPSGSSRRRRPCRCGGTRSRASYRARAGVVQVLADARGWRRRRPVCAAAPRSTASRSSRRPRPSGSTIRLISSQSPQPTSPTQSSLVPGRNVKRKGLRSP